MLDFRTVYYRKVTWGRKSVILINLFLIYVWINKSQSNHSFLSFYKTEMLFKDAILY